VPPSGIRAKELTRKLADQALALLAYSRVRTQPAPRRYSRAE
jgi:hypothetical protein